MKVPQAATAAVLAAVGAGLALALFGAWRPGMVLVGLAVLLAAGLRLSLPARQAGWLVVRSRAFDATLLIVLGLGLVGLAMSVPRP